MNKKEKNEFINWYCAKFHIGADHAKNIEKAITKLSNSGVSHEELLNGDIKEIVSKYGKKNPDDVKGNMKYLFGNTISKFRMFCGQWDECPLVEDRFAQWCKNRRGLNLDLSIKLGGAIRYMSDIGMDVLSGDERDLADVYMDVALGTEHSKQTALMYRKAIRNYREYMSTC